MLMANELMHEIGGETLAVRIKGDTGSNSRRWNIGSKNKRRHTWSNSRGWMEGLDVNLQVAELREMQRRCEGRSGPGLK